MSTRPTAEASNPPMRAWPTPSHDRHSSESARMIATSRVYSKFITLFNEKHQFVARRMNDNEQAGFGNRELAELLPNIVTGIACQSSR